MFDESIEPLWIEKYRPKSIDDYLFQNSSHAMKFRNFIAEKTIPHLLLSGVQGTGKTTIARILIDAMELDDMDILTIDASKNNKVEFVRDEILAFASTFSTSKFKIVHLAEADYLTLHAQAVLRTTMEDDSDRVRYILTCNYEHKIMPAIKSRCQHFQFKTVDSDDIALHLASILQKENIEFDLSTLDQYIAAGFPDIRKMIHLLQENSIDGKLCTSTSENNVADYKIEMADLLTNGKWVDLRKLLCSNVANEEWIDIYRYLYQNLHNSTKFNNKDNYDEAVIIISEHMRDHSIVADPEINAAAMFIRLEKI